MYLDPHLPVAALQRARGNAVEGSYLICIRTDGTVESVEPIESIEEADEAIAQHIETHWLYKPVPAAACRPRRFVFLLEG